jgi:peroxiredoxin Q/BCP
MKHLKVGDLAPAINGVDQNGHVFELKDYLGQRVVLYFYPKDNTPGCTAQACNLRDYFELLDRNKVKVIGVSPDDVQKHKKFENKYQLPFTLLADTDKKIVQDYGVWGEKKFMGVQFIGTHRTTFLIDEKGVIQAVIEKVKTKDHFSQIKAIWTDL